MKAETLRRSSQLGQKNSARRSLSCSLLQHLILNTFSWTLFLCELVDKIPCLLSLCLLSEVMVSLSLTDASSAGDGLSFWR